MTGLAEIRVLLEDLLRNETLVVVESEQAEFSLLAIRELKSSIAHISGVLNIDEIQFYMDGIILKDDWNTTEFGIVDGVEIQAKSTADISKFLHSMRPIFEKSLSSSSSMTSKSSSQMDIISRGSSFSRHLSTTQNTVSNLPDIDRNLEKEFSGVNPSNENSDLPPDTADQNLHSTPLEKSPGIISHSSNNRRRSSPNNELTNLSLISFSSLKRSKSKSDETETRPNKSEDDPRATVSPSFFLYRDIRTSESSPLNFIPLNIQCVVISSNLFSPEMKRRLDFWNSYKRRQHVEDSKANGKRLTGKDVFMPLAREEKLLIANQNESEVIGDQTPTNNNNNESHPHISTGDGFGKMFGLMNGDSKVYPTSVDEYFNFIQSVIQAQSPGHNFSGNKSSESIDGFRTVAEKALPSKWESTRVDDSWTIELEVSLLKTGDDNTEILTVNGEKVIRFTLRALDCVNGLMIPLQQNYSQPKEALHQAVVNLLSSLEHPIIQALQFLHFNDIEGYVENQEMEYLKLYRRMKELEEGLVECRKELETVNEKQSLQQAISMHSPYSSSQIRGLASAKRDYVTSTPVSFDDDNGGVSSPEYREGRVGQEEPSPVIKSKKHLRQHPLTSMEKHRSFHGPLMRGRSRRIKSNKINDEQNGMHLNGKSDTISEKWKSSDVEFEFPSREGEDGVDEEEHNPLFDMSSDEKRLHLEELVDDMSVDFGPELPSILSQIMMKYSPDIIDKKATNIDSSSPINEDSCEAVLKRPDEVNSASTEFINHVDAHATNPSESPSKLTFTQNSSLDMSESSWIQEESPPDYKQISKTPSWINTNNSPKSNSRWTTPAHSPRNSLSISSTTQTPIHDHGFIEVSTVATAHSKIMKSFVPSPENPLVINEGNFSLVTEDTPYHTSNLETVGKTYSEGQPTVGDLNPSQLKSYQESESSALHYKNNEEEREGWSARDRVLQRKKERLKKEESIRMEMFRQASLQSVSQREMAVENRKKQMDYDSVGLALSEVDHPIERNPNHEQHLDHQVKISKHSRNAPTHTEDSTSSSKSKEKKSTATSLSASMNAPFATYFGQSNKPNLGAATSSSSATTTPKSSSKSRMIKRLWT